MAGTMQAGQDLALADIIRCIDSAFSNASSSAITASKEIEEARNNARAAADLARKFMAHDKTSYKAPSLDISFLSVSSNGDSPSRKSTTPPKRPAPPKVSTNGKASAFMSSLSASALSSATGDYGHGNKRRATTTNTITATSSITQTLPPADLLAKSNTEKIVSLTLELDRANLSLETEQMAHDETRSALAQSKARNKLLESQMEQLLNDMETERENSGRRIDALNADLARATTKAQAADEDANLALQIATQNTDLRVESERHLQLAMEQLEVLQIQLYTPPPSLSIGNGRSTSPTFKRAAVRFADESSLVVTHLHAQPAEVNNNEQGPSPRALVNGRQLLQRSLSSPRSSSESSSSERPPIAPRTFDSMAERLRERLQTLNSVAETEPLQPVPYNHVAVAVANLLRESGRRLELTGRWWNNTDPTDSSVHVETLARHYCTSVEVSV
jgi:hypothetical protein